MISIKIVEIKSPGHFFCKEIDSESSSVEHQLFLQLQEEINETFNKDQIVHTPYIPSTGEVCIGLRSKDKKWYRVKSEGIFARKYGQEAYCTLIDVGGHESISVRWLRKSPERFLLLPHQLKEYCLYGVKAQTLAIQDDCSVKPTSCLVWDDSANTFMEKKVKQSLLTRAEVMYVEEDTGRQHVILHLHERNGEWINFNELLVTNNYAVKDETAVPRKSASDFGKSTRDRNKRHLQKILDDARKEHLSDSEIIRAHNDMSSASSEAEDDHSSRMRKNLGYMSESECQKSVRSKRSLEGRSELCMSRQEVQTMKYSSPCEKDLNDEQNYVNDDNYVPQQSPSVMNKSDSELYKSMQKVKLGRGMCTSQETDASPPISRGRSPTTFLKSPPVSRGRSPTGSVSNPGTPTVPAMSPNVCREGSSPVLSSSVGRGLPSSISSSVSRGRQSPISSNVNQTGQRTISPGISRGGLSWNSPDAAGQSMKSPGLSRGGLSPLPQDVTGSSSKSPGLNRGGQSSMSTDVTGPDTKSPGLSRGGSSPLSALSASVGRGRSPGPSPKSPTISRGRSQLETLRLAMSLKLPPSPNQSSASDIDSDCKHSPNIGKNQLPLDTSNVDAASLSMIENSGARPKVYKNTSIPGQFDDSESDSSRTKTGISVSGLIRNDMKMPISRARLPKVAQKKVGYSSGSDTDSSRKYTPKNIVPQPKISSGSDTDCAAGGEPALNKMNEPKVSTSPKKSVRNEKPSVRFSDEVSCSSETDTSPSKRKSLDTSPFKQKSLDTSPLKQKSPSPTKMTDSEKRRSDMISQLQGNQLLDLIKPGNQNKGGFSYLISQQKSQVERMDNLNQVLIHSPDVIKPIIRLEDAPLQRTLREAFRKLDFPAPKLIQAYAWKAILRGLNFIGLAPHDSGKTYAYLVPVISQILHTGPYKSLKGAQGPLAVFLVPSWKKVQQLYYITKAMLYEDNSKIRVIDLYGSEDLKMIPLITGCDILIATPPSLQRVLEHQYVHLNRLCHLVIDDAEVTLIDFRDEIQFIVSNYSEELRKQDERTAPQQLMLFGTQWEPVVQSFVKSYMPDPIIAIASRYEASLYGKVRQIPVICRSVQKPNTLAQMMDEVLKDDCRLIIFASTVDLACHLYELIKSCSLYALLAHDDMDKFDINEISSSWHCSESGEETILIATDLSIPHLYINDATTVIHYDLPDSKTKFGNRMSCMSKYYWNFLERDKEQKVVPKSYLLLTEESTGKIDTISSMLVRTKVKLPVPLKAMIAGRKQKKNLDKEKKLCTYMKAYGKCRFEDKCKSRHLIIPEVDTCKKFICGWVKIRITHVDDASHFYGIILEHTEPDGTKTDFRCDFTDLHFQMISYYGKITNRMRHTNMCIGDLCAYEHNDTFHRVKILDIVNLNSRESMIEADVKFVDDGKEERVPAKQLFDLPQKLKHIPFQTMDIYICRVKPVDRDDDWTPRARLFMHHLTIAQDLDENKAKNKELDGRIVLSMDNTLWLDPLVELIDLPAAQTVGRKMNVRMELLKNGFAVDNPKHLQDLYEACKGKIRIPDINKELHKSEKALMADLLPESKQYHDVYVSAVDLPNLFFVQRKETQKQLERMMDNLNDKMDRADDILPFTEKEVKDAVCIAKFPDDDRWYRVKILSEAEDDQVEVFYADYGDKRTIPADELYQLPPSFTELPLQAIECELAHVQPRGDDWEEESGDLFWDLTHMVCDDRKCVVAKIETKHNSMFTGIYRYEVELHDTETSHDVNLAQELVWSSLASPRPDSNLQDLFLVPSLARKTYKSSAQKIIDMCGIIYWEKNTERARSMPKEIYTIVEHNVKSAPLELIGYKALVAIIKLIGRISNAISHQWMLESLFCAAKNKRLCEEIIEQACEVGVSKCLEQVHISLRISKCLEQNCRPEIQKQAVIAIDKFLEISHNFVSVFGNRRNIEILCQLLDVSEKNHILKEIYMALRSLCSASKEICEWAHEFEVCRSVQKHLIKPEHQELEEVALKYLVKLMERDPTQMRKEKLIRAVISAIDRTENDKCILFGTKICENFCHDNRKHKTVLLECELAIILKRILNSMQLSVITRKLCQELQDSLVVKVPQATSIPRPLGQHQQQAERGVPPPVHWSQNTFRGLLIVKIKGVNSCDVHYTPQSVHFRAIVDGKTYTLDYELYGEIDPSKCVHQIKGSEVRISLRKVEKGPWPRLLREKQKPSNLSIDFERFVDSSSDSEVCDDDMPFVLKKSKKKQLPSNMSRPKKRQSNDDTINDSSCSEDSSSVSDEEVVHRSSADYDPYNIFA